MGDLQSSLNLHKIAEFFRYWTMKQRSNEIFSICFSICAEFSPGTACRNFLMFWMKFWCHVAQKAMGPDSLRKHLFWDFRGLPNGPKWGFSSFMNNWCICSFCFVARSYSNINIREINSTFYALLSGRHRTTQVL